MELDDAQQADDSVTRLVSGLFFLLGLQIQCLVVFHVMVSSLQLKEKQLDREARTDFELVPLEMEAAAEMRHQHQQEEKAVGEWKEGQEKGGGRRRRSNSLDAML
jgi:hypothetical protein